jgi:hypothetical protein
MRHFSNSTIYCGAIFTLLLPLCLSSGAFAQTSGQGIEGKPTAPVPGKVSAPVDIKVEAKKEHLPPCLANIAMAASIEDATLRTGIMRPNILEAQKMGPAGKNDLVAMLRSATPAGRVIALCLLKRIDPSYYPQYATQLRVECGDMSVSYISASERCHYTVSDILNDLESANPTIKVVY